MLPPNSSEPAVAEVHLLDIGLNTAQLHSVAVGEIVHGREADVETGCGVVNGENVNRPAVVRRRPARAAVGRVPTSYGLGAADVGEPRNFALVVPGQR
jgi:hypothetical protein